MAHSNVAGSTTSTDKIISSIRLPDGNVYEVHDSSAIHDVSELGLSAALVFKGTKATVANLPSTGNKTGDVWGVGDQEYVWVNRKIVRTGLSPDVEIQQGLYASLVSTTPLTKSQLIGATVSLYDVVDGARTITIDESKIKGETSDGLYVDCGTLFYIIVVYNEGYTPNISFLGNAFSKTGVYFSYTGLYDHQRVEELTLNEGDWELLGSVHDAASSTHKHNIKDVKGTNKKSAVTGSVTVPTITSNQKHLKLTSSAPTISATESSQVLGAGTKFGATLSRSPKDLIATISEVSVGANGTAKSITGFGAHTTAAAITALNTTSINNPTTTDVSVPNVTSNTSVSASKVAVFEGEAPSWNASVSNGVLSFNFIVGTIPPHVQVTDVTASKVTLGDNIVASKVTTSAVTVATGSKTTANAITALGTPTTATTLTGVKVTTQPTATIKTVVAGEGDVMITEVDGVTINVTKENINAITGGLSVNAIQITPTLVDAAETGKTVPVVTSASIGSTNVSFTGEAAAQEWSFTSGETDIPKE